jgi:hypothetical protein
MNWKPPESEHDWDEVLSSYLDGELSGEEEETLEGLLEKEPERRVQLEGLREASTCLRQWKVEVPEPDAGFLNRLDETRRRREGEARSKRTALSGWFGNLRPAFQTGLFAFGVFVGVLSTLSVQRFSPSPLEPGIATSAKPEDDGAGTPEPSLVSPEQGRELLREVEAGNLVQRIVGHLRGRDWAEAAATYLELKKEYSNTLALDQLDRDYPRIGSRAASIMEGRI